MAKIRSWCCGSTPIPLSATDNRGVAHDFNNLLVGIIGNASLAAENAGVESRAILEDIIKSAERAADLIRQLLAYAGKVQLTLQPLNLASEVRSILKMIRSSIHTKTAVVVEVDEQIPAIQADPGQIQQLVINLVINASEALQEHSGTVTIRAGEEDIDPEKGTGAISRISHIPRTLRIPRGAG
jgi:two-component system cell cycle sensor histidine kinase/response regulator CckA